MNEYGTVDSLKDPFGSVKLTSIKFIKISEAVEGYAPLDQEWATLSKTVAAGKNKE